MAAADPASRNHAAAGPDPSGDERPPSPDPDAAAEAAWADRPLDPRDYSRRTLLANERTFLAWWRTGLTALAAALAAARVVPELADADHRWPYSLLGVACAIAGVVAITYGHRRRKAVEDGLRTGTFPPMSPVVTGVLSGLGVLIGVGMLALIVVGP
ncbi:YidH family protein [Patulibacter minatonensis]|uniref:YidH family protein n=1 Tax=Patulibacter minatonensis TaxID=298163 RepID=UPI0004AC84F8|nr:DUF202 domain-containing protein [Patulibacter minatonensis]